LRVHTTIQTSLMLLLLAATATAQELSSEERARLRRVMRDGYRQYEEAARESAPARENLNHVRRMLDLVESRRSQLAERGIDADVARAGILFSDLGKNPRHLNALARELFPREYAEPTTRGAAMFRAFLLHEVPGRRLFRQTAREYGLSPETVARVEAANVGHNGPGARGSWWQTAWDAQIRNLRRVRLSGPHGSLVREYVGRSYPIVRGLEGALHTALDRRDQGTRDGSLKIMAERMGRGETLRDAFRASFGRTPGANQAMTQLQFDALRARYPQVFEIDIVREAERAVRDTARFRNHVQFNRAGTRARVILPSGRTIAASNFEDLQRALGRIEEPSARRPRRVAQPVQALGRLTVPQLVAEARRRGVQVSSPYRRAELLRALGASPVAASRSGNARTQSGAARELQRLLPSSARRRAVRR
jgi:hypothetical protein